MDSTSAGIVAALGEARPQTTYLLMEVRGTRVHIVVHDVDGLWLRARRLQGRRCDWLTAGANTLMPIPKSRLLVLLTGLPWQRLGAAIRVARVCDMPNTSADGMARVWHTPAMVDTAQRLAMSVEKLWRLAALLMAAVDLE